MPDKTINELETGTTLDGSERIPMWQNGTFYSTLTGFKNFILNSYAGAGSIVTVGTITNGTWSAKFAPRVSSITSGSTITPNSASSDILIVTALAAPATIAIPTGIPVAGQKLILRIKDNGTSRALTFNSIYRFSGGTAPTATTINKTMYLEFIYNIVDSKWDCLVYADNL